MNGARDTSGAAPNFAIDDGIGGVTVTAYDAAGAAQGTATTCTANGNPTAFCTGSNNGAYSLSATGTGPYRIEFTALPSGYSPSATGANNASTVRFIPDGASANIDLGVARDADYAQNDAMLATPVHSNGNPLGGGTAGTNFALVGYPYTANGESARNTTFATAAQIGSTWGAAWQPARKRLFTAALLKRHVGLGSQGLGGIYVTSVPGDGTSATTNFVDLENAPYSLNLGTISNNATRGLPSTVETPNTDVEPFAKIGKAGLGDIDLDETGNMLWGVNLRDGAPSIFKLDVSATAAGAFTNYPLSGFTGVPTCVNGVFRPWALAFRNGNGYLGGVCSAESAGGVRANLHAYVLSFNPNSPTTFTTVFSRALDYNKGIVYQIADLTQVPANTGQWYPWTDTYSDASFNQAASGAGRVARPTPILSDIEFDSNNAMVLGFMDRSGNQLGYSNYRPIASDTTFRAVFTGGDMLRACPNVGGTWDAESAGVCGGATGSGATNGQGPGGGEFFARDNIVISATDNHQEISNGALTYMRGTREIVATAFDPAADVSANGHIAHNINNGARVRGYQIYNNGLNTLNGLFGKANGIGDMELLRDPAPLQIGNRVWNDANGNGRQDPGEANIANVAVQLWADTNADGVADTQVGTATTDANGNYVFGGAGKANMGNNAAATCNTTVYSQPASSTDDGFQIVGVTFSDGTNVLLNNIFSAAGKINFGTAAAPNFILTHSGYRFPNLNIPQGATISSAHIQFFQIGDAFPAGATISSTIRGDAVDNAATFALGLNTITSRANSTASVDWTNIPAWPNFRENGANQRTPNISAIVQELVNRPGWAPNNAMAFVLTNTVTAETANAGHLIYDFDGGAGFAATLSVTYQTQCKYEVNPNTSYEVRVPAANFTAGQPLNTFALTRVNSDTTANGDSRDSDGNYSGGGVKVALTTGGYGENNHTYDFGFKTNTVSLGNRVFLDNGGGTAANANNGAFNAGETGISGVTVELYDSAGTTLLSTATTDASGYYSFPGLASGTAYHVRLAAANFNAGGVLANYGSSTGNSTEGATTPDANNAGSADSADKGTTTGVLGAGGYVQTRVAVTVTAGSAPTGEENGAGDVNADNRHNLKVDFGLVNYSLGNRVFLDNGSGTGGVANDGILNGTEAGIAGVLVSLFADSDCDNAIDNTASPLATVTTDSAGYYRFDNLKTVCYIVRVNPVNFQSGGVLSGRLSSAGNVNASSNTTDSRDNGINPASHGATGVLSNTVNVATKTKPTGETNPASYGGGATNGAAAADNSDDLTVDFGFIISGPTAVVMSDFEALSDGATTLLAWKSGSETNNLGYFVYRRQGKGEFVRLNDEPVAGSAFKVASGVTLTAGDAYYWRDQYVAGAEYYLEAVDLNGEKQQFGPVSARLDKRAAARLALAPNARTLSQLNNRSQDAPTQALLPKVLRAALRSEPNADEDSRQLQLAGLNAVKIGVRRDGWQRVTGAQLQAAGLPAEADAQTLQLYVDGREMPLAVRTDRGAEQGPLGATGVIEFFGAGLDERESDTRVYWLIQGSQPGLRLGAPARQAPRGGQPAKQGETEQANAPVVANSYATTARLKERSIYFSALNNGENEENFFGAGIVRNPVTRALQVSKPDNAIAARLEVVLQGASAGVHRVRVQFNGETLGFVEWTGQTKRSQRFDLPAGALAEGANSVTFNAEADGDVSLADDIRLIYHRRYEAQGNQLLFTLNPRQRTRVGGFANANVRLFDLTEPHRAYQVAARLETDATGYALLTPPVDGHRVLFAVSDEQALAPAFVTANQPSAWTRPENAADFLILTPAAFRPAAEQLAQARQAQGLRTAVVSLEDVFDEWAGGVKRTSALRGFLRYAQERWNQAPRYLLLLGDASYDPRDYLGLGGHDLVPTGYGATTYLETMSDESLADFDGDGLSEMALGRLPARDLAQAQAMVAKTLAYQPRGLADGALLIADQPDGYNFAAMNQQTANQLPAGTNATQWTRGQQPDAQFRQNILGALRQGPALVHYAGHGSVETWTGAGLLQSSDAAQLQNSRLTVYVMLTCLNGYFGDESTQSLAEALLQTPQGGAVAVWASTGLTAAPGQQEAAFGFYRAAYGPQAQRLGDATREAKRATSDPEVRSTWTLFADPTLQVR
jgi:hypothetical protein